MTFVEPRRAAQRPTVLLLHSSASSARQWDALTAALGTRFDVRAIDFHGHGAQRDWQREPPLTLADDAALVEPLLAVAGRAHVVGHSYGAAVALELATRHRDAVASVVAYEPVLFRLLTEGLASDRTLREVVGVAEVMRDRLSRNDESAAAQCFVDFWSGAGTFGAMPATRQRAVASRMRSVLGHFHALFRAPLGRMDLARLPMPLQFLTGAQTAAATSRIAEILRYAVPRARHDVLPGMGHMGPLTHPAEVNRRIAAFLDTQLASDSIHEPSTRRREHAAIAFPA
jgi:pimeloyl-ACP methyl ester carboxylesterase